MCLVYLDDVVVPGVNIDEHLQYLKCMFEWFQHAGLKLNLRNCHFGKREVTYLGHVVSSNGIAADPSKVQQVAQWPKSAFQKDALRFLGFVGYYWRFIEDFVRIAKPLHRLTEKSVVFKWTEELRMHIKALNLKLVSSPILEFPDYSREFILDTDASDIGIGCVLSQIHDDGAEHVIAHES